jgi:hypothetical protein
MVTLLTLVSELLCLPDARSPRGLAASSGCSGLIPTDARDRAATLHFHIRVTTSLGQPDDLHKSSSSPFGRAPVAWHGAGLLVSNLDVPGVVGPGQRQRRPQA